MKLVLIRKFSGLCFYDICVFFNLASIVVGAISLLFCTPILPLISPITPMVCVVLWALSMVGMMLFS